MFYNCFNFITKKKTIGLCTLIERQWISYLFINHLFFLFNYTFLNIFQCSLCSLAFTKSLSLSLSLILSLSHSLSLSLSFSHSRITFFFPYVRSVVLRVIHLYMFSRFSLEDKISSVQLHVGIYLECTL
jgi:hypothetical protein